LYAVLAGLICTIQTNERITVDGSFQSPFTAKTVMNGNWLICWTPALSRYTIAQLMC